MIQKGLRPTASVCLSPFMVKTRTSVEITAMQDSLPALRADRPFQWAKSADNILAFIERFYREPSQSTQKLYRNFRIGTLENRHRFGNLRKPISLSPPTACSSAVLLLLLSAVLDAGDVLMVSRNADPFDVAWLAGSQRS